MVDSGGATGSSGIVGGQSPGMAETSMSAWRVDMIRAKIDTRRETFMPRRKPMGEAREVMDRITTALSETKDFKAAAECYSTDAVAVTPDQGEITGRDVIVEYLRQFS